ncbi:rRNA maturation RNase YbeY [Schinkia sp. CFF1]
MIIDFIDEHHLIEEKQKNEIEKLMQFVAGKEGIDPEAEISITFVNNDEIQEINRIYRGKDLPTDVISFAMEEMGEGEIEIKGEDLPTILGDIIISIERTKEQAQEYNHSFMRELGFLTVHGFLHLLGYDHMEKEDEEIMFRKQKELLEEYGLHR